MADNHVGLTNFVRQIEREKKCVSNIHKESTEINLNCSSDTHASLPDVPWLSAASTKHILPPNHRPQAPPQ